MVEHGLIILRDDPDAPPIVVVLPTLSMLPSSSVSTQSPAALASAQVSSSLPHRGEHAGERNIGGGDSSLLYSVFSGGGEVESG
jgi:hypothetical protein